MLLNLTIWNVDTKANLSKPCPCDTQNSGFGHRMVAQAGISHLSPVIVSDASEFDLLIPPHSNIFMFRDICSNNTFGETRNSGDLWSFSWGMLGSESPFRGTNQRQSHEIEWHIRAFEEANWVCMSTQGSRCILFWTCCCALLLRMSKRIDEARWAKKLQRQKKDNMLFGALFDPSTQWGVDVNSWRTQCPCKTNTERKSHFREHSKF